MEHSVPVAGELSLLVQPRQSHVEPSPRTHVADLPSGPSRGAARGSRSDLELELTELDGEVVGVVLERGNVVGGLAETTVLNVGQPFERPAPDINQVGNSRTSGFRSRCRGLDRG